jgi:signal transduction histidine kinase
MLSGCVGVLPEAVRRQLYIIRTSGARLLALINDVMDAAALRQHRLVLKKERVPLRPLVDDMLDLTRPLVCQGWRVASVYGRVQLIEAANSPEYPTGHVCIIPLLPFQSPATNGAERLHTPNGAEWLDF